MRNTADITAGKHGGNAESQAANERNLSHRDTQRAQVLAAIAAAPNGLSAKELAFRWNVGMNQISGRFTELKRSGDIVKSGITRDGSAVLVATSTLFHTGGIASPSQTFYVGESSGCTVPLKAPSLPVKAFNAYADTDDPFEHQRAAHSYFEVLG